MTDANISTEIRPLSLIELIEEWQITQEQLKDSMPEAELKTTSEARGEPVILLEEIGVMKKVEKIREGYTAGWTEHCNVTGLNEQQYTRLKQLLSQLPIEYEEDNNCVY